MNASLQYIIERHEHGWLIKAPPGKSGVPVDALGEVMKLLPKKASLQCGIANAKEAVMALTTRAEAAKWTAEIETSLACSNLNPEMKWLRGTDVGASSKTIMLALRQDGILTDHRCAWPLDGDDFGRCHRLLERFPGWRERLPEVAARHPETPWPKLVESWPSLTELYRAKQWIALHANLRTLTAPV